MPGKIDPAKCLGLTEAVRLQRNTAARTGEKILRTSPASDKKDNT